MFKVWTPGPAVAKVPICILRLPRIGCGKAVSEELQTTAGKTMPAEL